MKYIWILCWDYGMVQKGSGARFKDSDITLSITDDSGKTISVDVDTGEMGNVCCIATIDNSGQMGPKLINTSKIGTLKGLKQLDQLMEIINS